LQPNSRPPSILKFAFILILASVFCISTLVLVIDVQCNGDIEAWIPLYPKAETVSVQYDFIRARAWGNSQVIQASPDDVETAKQFYRDTVIKLFDEERGRGLASTHWAVEPDPDTDGSLIILSSSCGI
jgi:hypothetical protein